MGYRSYSNSDGGWGTFFANIGVKLLSFVVIYLIMKSQGKELLDIPNYPINVDSPKIYDGDDNVAINDFSIITTNDEKEHLCYEQRTNGKVEYYDVCAKKVIDYLTIKSIRCFEDVISDQVPTSKGYGYPNQLKSAVEAELEEHHVKTLMPPKNN